jgi:hypothetical protein
MSNTYKYLFVLISLMSFPGICDLIIPAGFAHTPNMVHSKCYVDPSFKIIYD